MNAIWSYLGKPKDTNAELWVACASVLLWKKMNPTHNTRLYVDNEAMAFFAEKGIVHFWDSVIDITQLDTGINKDVFWAASKIIALSLTPSPVVHIDFDFFTWKCLKDYGLFERHAAASFEESTEYFYEPPKNLIKKTTLEGQKIHPIAYNTSLVYFGTDILKNAYTKMSLQYMASASLTDTSKIHTKNKSLYMVFAEQQLFGHVLKESGFSIKTLLNEKLIAGKNKYVAAKGSGIFNHKEANEHLVHLGEFKTLMRTDESYSNAVVNHIRSLFIDMDISATLIPHRLSTGR